MESFTEETFELQELPQSLKSSRKLVADFLAKFDLAYDTLDSYVGLFAGDKLVAGAGYQGATIKCVAVDPSYQQCGLSNKVISHLCSELWTQGVSNIFVFTKPKNSNQFTGAGFHLIASAPAAILLESSKNGIADYAKSLERYRQTGVQGAIVMNGNPFTLGHRYLVEWAARQCDHLHIFVVEEDKSIFPFHVRKRLIEEGTKDLGNVTVHSGGAYIISSATFPSYFIKELSEIAKTYAQLDLNIFAKHIAPALSITKRFVGSEPTDPLTCAYNEIMQIELPQFGVEPVILERKEKEGQPISASRVRKLLGQNDIVVASQLVPRATAAYFLTAEGQQIIEKLQRTVG
jgi:[citrate (pro-3S)-lyase] ligase